VAVIAVNGKRKGRLKELLRTLGICEAQLGEEVTTRKCGSSSIYVSMTGGKVGASSAENSSICEHGRQKSHFTKKLEDNDK
jgi:hypothetical protein